MQSFSNFSSGHGQFTKVHIRKKKESERIESRKLIRTSFWASLTHSGFFVTLKVENILLLLPYDALLFQKENKTTLKC